VPTRLTRLLASAILAVLACSCNVDLATPDNDAAPSAGLQEAQVVRVVDGDTIIVQFDGREERLRYIGIDAPESVSPDRPVECYGPEASKENERLVGGRKVYLEADTEDRDRYGRLLRYVYVDGQDGSRTMVNEQLVAGGFAEAGSYPPNERYSDDLFSAEREASRLEAGLWQSCP
jgi:micrococcal nuclease